MPAKTKFTQVIERLRRSRPASDQAPADHTWAGLDRRQAMEAAIKGASSGISRAITSWLLEHWND
ncbi:hypothetical protein BX265_8328 [Streptomyces sp. TLI_235]|nr:hypothetical protein [Streptomyces sp. TLI_235]PBC66269.1 hypothetical protein BX265_8328 [Streptomyces sp. TLI_235]